MRVMLEGAGLLHNGVVMVHDDHAVYVEVIYEDDPDGHSHYHLLRRYLKACTEMNVVLSPKTFEVFQRQVDIAGYMHERGGMRPCLPIYQSIVEQPRPTLVSDVYNYMCVVGWF